MTEYKLAAVEARFADIIWARQPIASGQLAEICGQELGWKRTTCYTVLKRLCERGLFSNDAGLVTARVAREDFYAHQGEQLVDAAFAGSLPAFIAAFTRGRGLSAAEAEEIRRHIDAAGEV